MSSNSFFWHDYETFGTDPQRDRVSQFAGIRTDLDFNPIDNPVMLYCQPSPDYLPQPEACLLTGITPQHVLSHGVVEAEFVRVIHEQLAQPGTCGLGYNSLRFDDEVTRNLLYRNFYDPYAREWQNNNSRWDIIDLVRATKALRPEGINWPIDENGIVSFKLQALTDANNIQHTAAHDALSDVWATIGIAKLIRQHQPKLYQFFFNHRLKPLALELLKVGSFIPVVHISGRFPNKNNCMAIVVALSVHPTNNNEIIVYDLAHDPEPLITLSAEEIRERLFVASEDLPEGVARIALKTVHINKCPILAPISVIRPEDAERLQLNLTQSYLHLDTIKTAKGLSDKLAEVFTRNYQETNIDPDLMIYSGGFFSNKDKLTVAKIRSKPADKLASFPENFDDKRLPEMLFRYRARNFPNTLSVEEAERWQQFCWSKLNERNPQQTLNFEQYFAKLQSLQQSFSGNPILKLLEEYGQQLLLKISA